MINYTKLGKEISYILWYAPWEYELVLDEQGWLPVIDLLAALNRLDRFGIVTEQVLHDMIARSPKKQYEIANGRIRTYYGYSVPTEIKKEK